MTTAKAIDLHIRDVENLRELATALLERYHELFEMSEEELVNWQREAKRRRGMTVSERIQ
jgi:hypothetical protein